MILVDKDIRELINANCLFNVQDRNIGSISCDLTSLYFTQADGEKKEFFLLEPSESVFVCSVEQVNMPKNMCAHIVLRNSRIREGLSLAAPVYQPGHITPLYFRLTNMSKQVIKLKRGDIYASLIFERLSQNPEKSYNGTYQSEFRFSGLGQYHDEYKLDLSEVQEKADNIKHLEKSIYSNVITLMTVFIALFSLINVNIDLAYAKTVEITRMIVFNLATIGSISFLVTLIRLALSGKPKTDFWVLLTFSIIVLLGAVLFSLQEPEVVIHLFE